MDQSERRRTRLGQLLDLAQTYRSWTRKELAKSLRRDPTKLIPGSGIPKLDFVVDLAGVLDWPVADVVAHLWDGKREEEQAEEQPKEFEALDEAAREAHRNGEYRLMIDFAKQAAEVATTAEHRARAHNREAGGWDGLGRYGNVLKAMQRALALRPVSAEFQRLLQSNLANAYYSLWSLVEARSIAGDLIAWYGKNPPETMRDRRSQAFAHYVAGHSHRRLMSVDSDQAQMLAESARADLQTAFDLYEAIGIELDDDSYRGIANTCKGGLIEVDVVLGERSVRNALAELSGGLDEVADSELKPVGDRLESYGWWCIFGCNIALANLRDERELQQHMAVFTNKADEIAERLDNWAMRERVFTMEHSRWERAVGSTGFDIPRVVDEEDVKVITGTMARFPTFRETGWEILRSAKVVRAN
ncbi:MAG: hypothetical protein GY715_22050 [Planctomycetes bacterium]|nr:hypothetical protein [Planctomycetota bacterium]